MCVRLKCWRLCVLGIFKRDRMETAFEGPNGPGTMFNGSVEGPMTMEFICPEDMAEYDPERRSGRIRLRPSAGRKYLQDAGNL